MVLGILVNRALLAKQGWRLLKNPTSLASRVLKGRYFLDFSFLEVGHCFNGSLTWKGLLWGKGILDAGTR